MLQQTQVTRVEPYYTAFLERFPTALACAAATAGDVLRQWSGLGYNQRAVRLHRAALVVVAEHDGRLPETVAELQRLPGVGPYTARAVMAYAHEVDAALVETNIARVLARFHGRRLGRAEVQALADAALPRPDAWAWNQVLMDLGATVCTARRPACGGCPLAGRCAWRAARGSDPDPAVGSAGVGGGQSRFDGSDRQGRGRLVRLLSSRAVGRAELPSVMGWPGEPERAERVAAGLVADGLAVVDLDGRFALP